MSSNDIGKIAKAIIQSLGGVGVANAQVLGCGSTSGVGNPWACTPGSVQTFECSAPQSYRCGGTSGSFSCDDAWPTDDFECMIDFSCPGPNGFACIGSFDDEDCEGVFNCTAFTCANGGGDYNN